MDDAEYLRRLEKLRPRQGKRAPLETPLPGSSVLDVPVGGTKRIPDTVLRRRPEPEDTITGLNPSMAQRHAEKIEQFLSPRSAGPKLVDSAQRELAKMASQTLMGGDKSLLPFGIGLQEAVPFSPYVAEESGAMVREGVETGSPLTTGLGLGLGALQAFPVFKPIAKGVQAGAMAAGRAGERLAERVVPQVMERGGLGAEMLGAMGTGTRSPLDVWHGSPHKFDPEPGAPLGQFRAEKIGSGEGAQSYGHGIYTSETPDVATEYRNRLSGGMNAMPPSINTPLSAMNVPKEAAARGYNEQEAAALNLLWNASFSGAKSRKELLQKANEFGDLKDFGTSEQVLNKVAADVFPEGELGFLYKADLPDEMIPKMLDWDKPISEQSKEIQAIAKKLDTDLNLPGRALYNQAQLKVDLGEGPLAPAASNWFREQGIPGIKYLDEQSRGASGTGKWRLDFKDGTSQEFNFKPNDDVLEKMGATATPIGTRNFVIFPGEEKKLRILQRNEEKLPDPAEMIKSLEAEAKAIAQGMRDRAKADRAAGLDQISDETLQANRADADRVSALMGQIEALKKPKVQSLPERKDPKWYEDLQEPQLKTVREFDDWGNEGGYSLRKPGSNPEDDLHTSAQSNFTDYEVVPGVRSVDISKLGELGGYGAEKDVKRIQNLAEQIKSNKEITPIFVGIDQSGAPYVIEGQHRVRAFKSLGMDKIPAKVIVDMEGSALQKLPDSSQWKTPEFKQWFGDSKVVDERGKPLRVYHGTNQTDDFEEGQAFSQFLDFRPVWFASNTDTSNVYASPRGGGSPTTYPVYLSIKNPLRLSFDMDGDVSAALPIARRLGVSAEDLKTYSDGPAYDLVRSRPFVEAAQAKGYDGIAVNEGGQPTFAVFDSTQIKSAIGNRGTYNPKDPDITKAQGGFVQDTDALVQKLIQSGMNEEEAMVQALRMAGAREEARMAGGGLAREAGKAIGKAAQKAEMAAPVTATKDLTTVGDFRTSLLDRVRIAEEKARQQMETFDYKYDKGQRVFTQGSAEKNMPPYTIISRTRVGNVPMREDPKNLLSKTIKDPETGKAKRTPYEPGYRVRMERAPGEFYETDIPQSQIIGEVEMAGGGRLLKTLKGGAKAAKEATPTILPPAPPLSKEQMRPIAQRVASQMTGEFVRPNPKQSINPAGKSQKVFQRERNLPVEITEKIPQRPAETFDVEKYEGYGLVGVPGDPTIGGVAKPGSLSEVHEGAAELKRLGDVEFEHPVQLFGGPRYGAYGPDFWASNIGPARAIQNRVGALSQALDAPVLGEYIKMSPESSNFALHNLDALLSYMEPEKLGKQKIKELNEEIRKGSPKLGKFPGFAGFQDPVNVLLQSQIHSDLRKHIAETLMKPTVAEKFGMRPGSDVLFGISKPDLRELEPGISGYSIGKMKPGAALTPSLHPTYDYDIPGTFFGQSKYPTPYEIAFPASTAYTRSQLKPGVQEFNMLKMVGPREKIDPQYIDQMKMYEELMKEYTGKKDGGAVTPEGAEDFIAQVQKKIASTKKMSNQNGHAVSR